MIKSIREFISRCREGTASEQELQDGIELLKAVKDDPAALQAALRREKRPPLTEEEEGEYVDPEEDSKEDPEEELPPPRRVRKAVDQEPLVETGALLKSIQDVVEDESVFDALPILQEIPAAFDRVAKAMQGLREEVQGMRQQFEKGFAPAAETPDALEQATRKAMAGVADRLEQLIASVEGRPHSPHQIRKSVQGPAGGMPKGLALDRLAKAFHSSELTSDQYAEAAFALDHPERVGMTPEQVLETYGVTQN